MKNRRGSRVEAQLAPIGRVDLAYGVRLETAPTSGKNLTIAREPLVDLSVHRHYRRRRLSNLHRQRFAGS